MRKITLSLLFGIGGIAATTAFACSSADSTAEPADGGAADSSTATDAGPPPSGDGGKIDYNDPTRFANKKQDGTCPDGFQKTFDPFTSKCITVRECIDPGKGGACRAYCANRNVYGTQPKTGPDFECISSVDNIHAADGEFWPNSCDHVNNNALNEPTKLPIDCRCTGQLGRTNENASRFARCYGPLRLQTEKDGAGAPLRIGTGPGITELRGDKGFSGGFIDQATRKFIVGGRYSDAPFNSMGLIFSIDIDTGARTILAGAYLNPATGIQRFGCSGTPAECASGAPIDDDLRTVQDVKRGPDGKLYAYVSGAGLGSQIWRVEADGKHSLVWREEIRASETAKRPTAAVNSNQCWNGVPDGSSGVKVVQLHQSGWTMDPQGNHYFAVQPNGAPVGPNGIIKISADGTTCSWATRYFNDAASSSGPLNAHRNQDVGTGNVALMRFDWRALYFYDNSLWGRNASALVKIDPATGNRVVVSNADVGAAVGGGAAMGDRWLQWDPARQRMWTTGGGNSTSMTGVDLANGNRDDMSNSFEKTNWYNHIDGALQQNYQLRGGFDFDERGEKDMIVVHNNFAIVRYEIRTGNSYTISF